MGDMIEDAFTGVIMLPILMTIFYYLVKLCKSANPCSKGTNIIVLDSPPSYIEIEVDSELPKYGS